MSESDGLTPRQEWAVVATLAVCIVGAPLAILFWPPTFVPYVDAYLGLALVPGLVMGVVAVLAALRSGNYRER